MTIIAAKQAIAKASQAARAGDHIRAAVFGLRAQRIARASRSKYAYEIECLGHGMAVGRGNIAAQSCVYSSAIKASAGRIASESQFLFNNRNNLKHLDT